MNSKKLLQATEILMRSFWTLFICFSAAGCASKHYNSVEKGSLAGSVIVEWRKPDSFVYRPDLEEPLVFTRSDGQRVIPERMWTDGGSIPRPLWTLRNYSPWGYGPAFIVHDWLFRMQDCELPGYEDYDIEVAALIMSEVMKTLIEDPDFESGSKSSMYLMFKAVQSRPAQIAWSDKVCVPLDEIAIDSPPDSVFRVSFD